MTSVYEATPYRCPFEGCSEYVNKITDVHNSHGEAPSRVDVRYKCSSNADYHVPYGWEPGAERTF